MKTGLSLLWLSAIPVFAFPAGAPPGNTGAPGNGTCVACHRSFPLNSAGGSVRVEAVNYKPGIAQTLRVTVSHPEAQRWGFQLTARWAKDPLLNVGTFTAPNGDVQILEGGYVTHTAPGTRSNGANGAKKSSSKPSKTLLGLKNVRLILDLFSSIVVSIDDLLW